MKNISLVTLIAMVKIRTGDANAILWYTVDDISCRRKIIQCW